MEVIFIICAIICVALCVFLAIQTTKIGSTSSVGTNSANAAQRKKTKKSKDKSWEIIARMPEGSEIAITKAQPVVRKTDTGINLELNFYAGEVPDGCVVYPNVDYHQYGNLLFQLSNINDADQRKALCLSMMNLGMITKDEFTRCMKTLEVFETGDITDEEGVGDEPYYDNLDGHHDQIEPEEEE